MIETRKMMMNPITTMTTAGMEMTEDAAGMAGKFSPAAGRPGRPLSRALDPWQARAGDGLRRVPRWGSAWRPCGWAAGVAMGAGPGIGDRFAAEPGTAVAWAEAPRPRMRAALPDLLGYDYDDDGDESNNDDDLEDDDDFDQDDEDDEDRDFNE